MRFRTFMLSLLMVLVLCGLTFGQSNPTTFTYKPYVAVSTSVAGDMGQQNPNFSFNTGVVTRYQRWFSKHELQYDTANSEKTGDGFQANYDGNLLYRFTEKGFFYGGGVRVTHNENAKAIGTVARPYIVAARAKNNVFTSLKFIFPGNDKSRDQYGVFSQTDIKLAKHYSIYLTAGLFSYHPSPVLKTRELGGNAGVGFKYWFK